MLSVGCPNHYVHLTSFLDDFHTHGRAVAFKAKINGGRINL